MFTTPISETMHSCAENVQREIESFFDALGKDEMFTPELAPLLEAMRYSTLSGGKRIRPFLAMSFTAVCGKGGKAAKSYAIALEMVHTYSLIHDDLPCMDNDDMRRGRPTNHKVYGEARALLAGDALLTHAFGVLASAPLSAEQNIAAIKELSRAAGALGMIGGQEIDLASEGKSISGEVLTSLHEKKTGEMIKASCRLGCIAAGVFEGDAGYEAATKYAEEIGIAFQIVDDILDVVGGEKLGKNTGSDERRGKTTYVTLYGIEKARELAHGHVENAKRIVTEAFGTTNAHTLCEVANFIVERDC